MYDNFSLQEKMTADLMLFLLEIWWSWRNFVCAIFQVWVGSKIQNPAWEWYSVAESEPVGAETFRSEPEPAWRSSSGSILDKTEDILNYILFVHSHID